MYNLVMVKSVYIHIPFCKSKCHYCSFVSFNKLELKKEYLKALGQEIKQSYQGELLNTIYFGGGTPSLLTVQEFENLLRYFNINENTEITTELNPDSCYSNGNFVSIENCKSGSYDYLRGLYDIGINRLSFGCQTFNNDILKQINRRHTSNQVIDVVKTAQRAGFNNISLDFIYGLPHQTPEMFYDDLKRGINLGIQHISLYGLKIEDGSWFYKNMPEHLPDDDTQADMYLGAIKLLTEHGFEHYEVSNFSKYGYNSKHNLNYWNNDEYYGFGVAAHGYLNSVRYGNVETLEEYLQNPLNHKESKILTEQEKLEEEIFLGFRKMKGIDVQNINFKYQIDFDEKYKNILEKYLKLKLIEKTNIGYKLTVQGILVSNVILADFLD